MDTATTSTDISTALPQQPVSSRPQPTIFGGVYNVTGSGHANPPNDFDAEEELNKIKKRRTDHYERVLERPGLNLAGTGLRSQDYIEKGRVEGLSATIVLNPRSVAAKAKAEEIFNTGVSASTAALEHISFNRCTAGDPKTISALIKENQAKKKAINPSSHPIALSARRTDPIKSSLRSLIQDDLAGSRIFRFDGTDHEVPIKDRVDFEMRTCAGQLGVGPLTLDDFVQPEFVAVLHGLASRGISVAGLQAYMARVVRGGVIDDPLFSSQNELSRKSAKKAYMARAVRGVIDDPLFSSQNELSRKSAKIEQIPNLFRDIVSLSNRSPALQKLAITIKEEDLEDSVYLEALRDHLNSEKELYFGSELVSVVIIVKAPAGETNIRAVVRQAYNLLEDFARGTQCVVKQHGSNIRDWVMGCEGTEGTSRNKKEARMICLIKRYFDPTFDPSNSAYVPTRRLARTFDTPQSRVLALKQTVPFWMRR